MLDEAARQLNERGVLLTSLAEIAAKLGVTRGAMYYYVADREDLVFQCYRRAAEIIARHLLGATRAGGTAADVLRGFVRRMLDPNEPEIAARAEIAMMNPTQRDTIQGLYDALAARLAHLLETGQREGVLRACDVEVNARIILSLVTWAPLVRPWAHIAGALDPTRLLSAVEATVFDGFSTGARLPEFRPLDLAALTPRAASAFDRDATLAAKREMLIRVASRLFNRKGIDATSLDEIAAQVGTTKRTLHHHIGSKQDVVSACYDRAFRIFFVFVTHDQSEAIEISDKIVVINRGKVEQIGNAHEVYEHPESRFVASFIGQVNVIDAVIKDNKIVIKDTNLAMDNRGSDTVDGSEILLLVRPEDIVLQENPASNSLPCRIRQIHYRGSFYELDIAIGTFLIKAIENKNSFMRDNWSADRPAFIEFKKYKVFDIREGHGAVREQLPQLGYIE